MHRFTSPGNSIQHASHPPANSRPNGRLYFPDGYFQYPAAPANRLKKALACALFALAALAFLPRALQAQTAPTDTRYLLTDKEAVLLLPPELIAANAVNMDWAPDSRHVVAVRYRQPMQPTTNPMQPPPPSEIDIVVWNGVSLHAQESWKRIFPYTSRLHGDLQWLPTTPTAIQEISWLEKTPQPGPDNKPIEILQTRQLLLFIDSQRGFVKEIPETEGDQIFLSPTRPHSVIVRGWPNINPEVPCSLIAIRSDGALSPPVTLPAKMGLNNISWSEDGSRMNLLLMELLPEKKGVLTHWMQFNPQTGALTALTAKPANYKPDPKPVPQPLQIKPALIKAQMADTQIHLPALWLESAQSSEQPRTLLAADAKNGKLAPDGRAVLYSSSGAAWVTPLFRISKEEFKAAQIKSQRLIALSNAKQLALGLLMWAADHDDAFPNGDNLNAELTPYLRSDALFEGFNYTYKGGPIADIAEPANTVIGTVEGPGGSALLYADGHAKWKDR